MQLDPKCLQASTQHRWHICLKEEEAADRQGVTSVNPLLVAFVVGVTFSALLLLAPLISPLPRPKLQNDPMCGIPTGGQV